MERWRRVTLLRGCLSSPVTVVLWLVGVEREVRLLRMVAVMVMEVGVALNRGQVCTTVTIVVGMGGTPYLALLRSSGVPFILV